MSGARLLFLDPDSFMCEHGNCSQILKLLHDRLTHAHVCCIRTGELERHSSKPQAAVLRLHSLQKMEERLRLIRSKWEGIPVLGVLCFQGVNAKDLPNCFPNGLDDFVVCPVGEFDLCARATQLLRRAVVQSIVDLSEVHLQFDSLVGESPPFTQVLSKLPMIANSSMTVLLTGETGTGKELVARAIHYLSPRKGYPFIPVNCGSLPDHLLENELFGHVKGAYTDASTHHSGLLGIAEGGSLFLDEIDGLTAGAQVKLLRFIQDHEYRPLGSNRTFVANVRVIAATNTDLRQLVRNRAFREDLFHRLNVLHLSIPPLRERADDIPRMVSYFLKKVAQQEAKETKRLTWAALQKLRSYDWPGNVRELEGVIQRAAVMSTAQILDCVHIELPTDIPVAAKPGKSLRELKNDVIEQLERNQLVSLLAAHHGNVTRAAREAGTTRRTLQRLVRKYDLERRRFDDRDP
jgi:transcriptional regulator with GAF, ATPase, and Fis domain